MLDLVQYIPTCAAAISGGIAIFLKLSGSTKAWPQYCLLGVIVLAFGTGIYLTTQKLTADANVKAYAAATGIKWDKGFDQATLVLGVNDFGHDDKGDMLDNQKKTVKSYLTLVQSFFPDVPDGTKVGDLEVFGEGLLWRSFELSKCGSEMIIDERSPGGELKRYFQMIIKNKTSSHCRARSTFAQVGARPKTMYRPTYGFMTRPPERSVM